MKYALSLLIALVSFSVSFAQDTIRFKTVLKGHQGPVEAIAYSKDGSYFASGGWDNSVRIYSVDSLDNFEYLYTIKGHHAGHRSCRSNS